MQRFTQVILQYHRKYKGKEKNVSELTILNILDDDH